MEGLDVGGLQCFDEADQLGVFVGCGNEEELEGLAGENALDGFPQLIKVVVDRRDDDCHIFACVGGFRRDWDRLVAPMADCVDDES